jgi:cysteine-rich repeat protein
LLPPVTTCGDGNIDWPNTSGIYEECDNGNIYSSGCDIDCKLTIPTCVLTGNASSQIL